MADETDKFLFSLFSDSFKREVDADEAVWRSLPFFAAAIGLALAVLGPAFKQAPTIFGSAWRYAVYVELILSVITFGWAARWFWSMMRPRTYRYPPSDAELRTYAGALTEFHKATGEAGDVQLDTERELRAFVTTELAEASTHNRALNQIKSTSRSNTLVFLVVAFVFAFLSEATIFASTLFAGRSATTHCARVYYARHEQPRRGEFGPSDATDEQICRGGGAAHAVQRAAGGWAENSDRQKVSDPKSPPQPAKAPPERPTPPQPSYLKKSDNGSKPVKR